MYGIAKKEQEKNGGKFMKRIIVRIVKKENDERDLQNEFLKNMQNEGISLEDMVEEALDIVNEYQEKIRSLKVENAKLKAVLCSRYFRQDEL